MGLLGPPGGLWELREVSRGLVEQLLSLRSLHLGLQRVPRGLPKGHPRLAQEPLESDVEPMFGPFWNHVKANDSKALDLRACALPKLSKEI